MRTTLLVILGSSSTVEGNPAVRAAELSVAMCVVSMIGLRLVRFGPLECDGETFDGAFIGLWRRVLVFDYPA